MHIHYRKPKLVLAMSPESPLEEETDSPAFRTRSRATAFNAVQFSPTPATVSTRKSEILSEVVGVDVCNEEPEVSQLKRRSLDESNSTCDPSPPKRSLRSRAQLSEPDLSQYVSVL